MKIHMRVYRVATWSANRIDPCSAMFGVVILEQFGDMAVHIPCRIKRHAHPLCLRSLLPL